MYTLLDPDKILQTAEGIQTRIRERFPDSGLYKISSEIILLGRRCAFEVNEISKPVWSLRVLITILALLFLGSLIYIFSGLKYSGEIVYSEVLQALDAAMSSLVMSGATIIFLMSLEKKYKLQKALHSIHSLRSLAHVIDMHQLTKDPYQFAFPTQAKTESSPKRQMSLFELSRYYDYCTELLSVLSKIAALYPQHLDDRAILNTVDDVESLTDGLSRKIWQKISLVNDLQRDQ